MNIVYILCVYYWNTEYFNIYITEHFNNVLFLEWVLWILMYLSKLSSTPGCNWIIYIPVFLPIWHSYIVLYRVTAEQLYKYIQLSAFAWYNL